MWACTAYHGAAPLITDKENILPAAVGIHAVEAYHAGLVRTSIAGLDADGTLLGLHAEDLRVAGLAGESVPAPTTAMPNPVPVIDDFGIMNVTSR